MLEVAKHPSPPGKREAPMETAYDGRQVVGIDLHRRRSVLVRMAEDGRRLGTARITNNPQELGAQIARAGKSPRVVLEATFGWYWAADTLAAAGAEVHLAHPLGVRAFSYRRGEKTQRGRGGLVRRPPPGKRLVTWGPGGKAEGRGGLASPAAPPACTDIFGVAGSA